ncbi:MAG: hypothetical protein JJE21_01795 [Spirochaetaceae bacterium]|nr:hypothetical protein [Spirochaetaceae bacterium]
MINYIQKLIVVSDVENLAPFAMRHTKISKLNKLMSEAFNINGIGSSIYLSICAQLYDLYSEDEDYEQAYNIALNIYQGSIELNNETIKTEAIINLIEADLNINDILEAKKYYSKLNIHEDNFYYPQYLVCKSQMAELEKNVKNETDYLRAAYNCSIKVDNPIDIQINILCALCLSFEKNKIFEKAFHAYIELSNQIAQNNYQLTNEQQLSLNVRIANLAGISKNYNYALEIFSTLSNVTNKILRENHPLKKIINDKFEIIKTFYKNQTNI